MQVTRRVPSAVHFVNIRNLSAPLQAKPILLQAFRIRRADCNFRFDAVAPFSSSATRHVEGRLAGTSKGPPQEGDGAVKTDINQAIAQEKEKQTRAPWHREGSNKPPNSDRKDVEPLALLVHPQQPLSYLERLIQSELPTVTTARGEEKIPAVHFRAEDSPQDEIMPAKKEPPADTEEQDDADLEESKFDGKTEKTGILNRKKKKTSQVAREEESSKPLGEGSVESYSGLGREGPDSEDSDKNFVRWSPSTEIGDFIRDAARGKEFAVEIEGAPQQIRIGVPSFNDRTHYLRHRLRKTSTKIMNMATIKKECDMAAHRGAQRVAIGGAMTLVGYWSVVYWLTFRTDLGWDTMEPVTYLVGLSTLICGYLWFLYHNREVSYRAALNLTISRRQTQLYQAKGFDLPRWEALVEEGNALRREIKQVASEYDVEWDERSDEKDEKVTEALREVRDKKKEGRKEKGGKGDEEDEDED
ncbi:MAG: hypothetical protein LQ339_002387 [Xanthoria mediterranea]|nr:MAG: hypothetical protein LQ339_002387 [Xanthoria mediterranea]